MKRTALVFFSLCCLVILPQHLPAQNLDGRPYNPETDPNVDMFMGSWQLSLPRHSHGSIIERDILTTGDQLNPPRKGAVLEWTSRFAHATLAGNASTVPVTLDGEQEIFYILTGTGELTGGGKTHALAPGKCVLVPEGLEFTMTNTGNAPLTMYLIADPTEPGFTPREDIYVADNNTMKFNSTVGHWSYREKDLLLSNHGLSTLYAVITLTLDPMTIGHPHVHVKGIEEVWTVISGHNIAWLGKELREQPPGTAYMIPPDGKTNHSNINQSKTDQVVLLYFAVRK